MTTRRLFSADSHCVITSDQVKANLATKYHENWDAGMLKYDAKRSEQMAGGSLELEDFVDLEAARHPGYFDSNARLEAMDADGVECEVMYSEFDFTSKVYQPEKRTGASARSAAVTCPPARRRPIDNLFRALHPLLSFSSSHRRHPTCPHEVGS